MVVLSEQLQQQTIECIIGVFAAVHLGLRVSLWRGRAEEAKAPKAPKARNKISDERKRSIS